jgi:hypothetical protein
MKSRLIVSKLNNFLFLQSSMVFFRSNVLISSSFSFENSSKENHFASSNSPSADFNVPPITEALKINFTTLFPAVLRD